MTVRRVQSKQGAGREVHGPHAPSRHDRRAGVERCGTPQWGETSSVLGNGQGDQSVGAGNIDPVARGSRASERAPAHLLCVELTADPAEGSSIQEIPHPLFADLEDPVARKNSWTYRTEVDVTCVELRPVLGREEIESLQLRRELDDAVAEIEYPVREAVARRDI